MINVDVSYLLMGWLHISSRSWELSWFLESEASCETYWREDIYHYSVISKTQEIYPNTVQVRGAGLNHHSEVEMFWFLYEQALSRIEANCIPPAELRRSMGCWEQVSVQAASLLSHLFRFATLKHLVGICRLNFVSPQTDLPAGSLSITFHFLK